MRLVEIIKQKKVMLISFFLFIYIVINLFDGERGLISYLEKQKIIEHLIEEKKSLFVELEDFENKNKLLTDIVDLDYLETLYREKFLVGKENEKIFKNN